MSIDWTVTWGAGGRPTRVELGWAIEDYFGGAAVGVQLAGDVFTVRLHGTYSEPFTRVNPAVVAGRPDRLRGRERWVEVWDHPGHLVVLTRQQDECTNALAAGLAEALRRYWDAILDSPS